MKQFFTLLVAAFLCLLTNTGHTQFSNNFDTNGSGTRDIYTPYLNIASTTFSVSFNYNLSSTLNGQAVRTIEAGLLNRDGVFTSLDVITMDRNTPNIIQTQTYNKTFTLATTGYRLKVVKKNGTAFYSSVVLLQTAAEAEKITLLQNPVQNTLRFTLPVMQQVNAIAIYTISGALVHSEKNRSSQS